MTSNISSGRPCHCQVENAQLLSLMTDSLRSLSSSSCFDVFSLAAEALRLAFQTQKKNVLTLPAVFFSDVIFFT